MLNKSMLSKKDVVYLKHIRDAIINIENYLEGRTYIELETNSMVLDAVVRNLEIIGETTNNLSDDFQNGYSEIIYSDIVSMRNFLIHEYFGVNPKVVWDTCKTDLPILKKQVLNILQQK